MVFSTAFAGFLLLVDPLGGAPIFLSLTAECTAAAQVALALRATLIASSILLVFILLGHSVFDYFGIMPAVFKVAGGALLFSSSAHLIGNNSATARKTIGVEDELQEPHPIPATPVDDLPVHETPQPTKQRCPATTPVRPTLCRQLYHWVSSLPVALRSPQVQLEVREKTPCIIFPMVIPLMAGPGAIAFAVLITELAREEATTEWLAVLEVILALAAVMVVCLLAFTTSRAFVSRLGETFSRVSTVFLRRHPSIHHGSSRARDSIGADCRSLCRDACVQSVVGILVASIGVQYVYDGLLSLLIDSLHDVRLQAALAAVWTHTEAANSTSAN